MNDSLTDIHKSSFPRRRESGDLQPPRSKSLDSRLRGNDELRVIRSVHE
jgi:hypothetical protein